MKPLLKLGWCLTLLLISRVLLAEVAVDPAEYSALQEIESHISESALFQKLTRVDDPKRRRISSYAVNDKGHVVSLYVSRVTYENLAFLREFPHLRFLTISESTALTSMQGIDNNVLLEKIWLVSVPVTRIEGLAKMERLKLLSIYEGALRSMEGVSNTHALEYLVLNNNKLEHIEGLLNLKKLKRLNLSNNPLLSMTGLGEKPALADLLLYNTRISRLEDYGSLSKMTITVNENFSFEENKKALSKLKARRVRVIKI
ncbi:MAG: hypothetical protein V7629_18300 [Motiliproteus sp.]